MDFTCLLILPVLSYLKLVLLNEAETGKYLKCFPVKHSFKLILRNVCLYTQPNVTMTPKHIMQTRSTQSTLTGRKSGTLLFCVYLYLYLK
jgi:hypothetical protein